VRKLIYQRAGISLHDGKHAMVYSRLSRRLRETGHRSFAATCSGWRRQRPGRRASGRSSSTA
jgi:chemotaxis protein methyltransferase CheR